MAKWCPCVVDKRGQAVAPAQAAAVADPPAKEEVKEAAAALPLLNADEEDDPFASCVMLQGVHLNF